MCIACVEYNKGKLNIDEFRSAVREITQDEKEHYEAVQRILTEYEGQPDEIKKRLAELMRA